MKMSLKSCSFARVTSACTCLLNLRNLLNSVSKGKLLHIKYFCLFIHIWLFVRLFCLTPLSTIFQLYRGGQFYWRRKPKDPENHQPVASHWQTLSHNVVHLALIEIRTHNISGDRHRLHRYSCKSNYHTIDTMTAPYIWYLKGPRAKNVCMDLEKKYNVSNAVHMQ